MSRSLTRAAYTWTLAGAVLVVAGARVLAGTHTITAAVPLFLVPVLLFLGGAAIALRGVVLHHPFPALGPANALTGARLVLTAWVAGLLAAAPTDTTAWLAVGLAFLALALDGIDGWAARRSGLASPFGARFDMEVDALLILVLSALVWRSGRAGAWVLASGLMRYAFVAAAGPWTWLARPLPPSRRRQTVCVVQIGGLLMALAPIVPAPLGAWLAAVSLVQLAWSFGVDVAWLWRRRRV